MNGKAEKEKEAEDFHMKSFDDGHTKSESTTLVDRTHRVSLKTAEQLRYVTLVVCWCTVIILGSLGVATLVIGVTENSSASFAFALGAFLDCLSSLVVLWRFVGNASQLYSAKRERIACIILGLLFCLSAVVITAKSTVSFIKGVQPGKDDAIWAISIANAIICFTLVIAKSYLANKLESTSIATDAVNSAIGAVLALSTLIGDLVYDHNSSVWYLDAVLGVVCAVFLLGYGIWLIVYETCLNTKTDEAET